MPLHSVCAHVTKGSTPTTFGFSWEKEGIPFLRSECVRNGSFSLVGSEKISTGAHTSMARSTVRGGDILMTITGYVGRSCRYPPDLPEANINQHIARIRVTDTARVDPSFVGWALQDPRQKARLERDLTGLAYPQISLAQVQAIPLPVPRLPEQRRIAEILDTLDEAIRKTEQLIVKLKQVKQGLLHDLLTRGIDDNGELRDPLHQPDQFRESVLGRVPRSWSVQALGENATVFNGSTPPRAMSSYWDGDVPWLSSGKVNDYIIRSASESISKEAVTATHLRLVPRGAVVVGLVGEGKTRGMSARLELEATINQNLAAIVPRNHLRGVYLHLFLVHHYEALRGGGRGSNQDALNCDLIRHFCVAVPPPQEQVRIEQILLAIEARIDGEAATTDKLSLLKIGLMKDLLSGRIQVTSRLGEVAG